MPGRSAVSLLSKSWERKPGHSLRVLKSFLESEVSAAAAPSSACPLRLFFPPDKTQFLWADQRVRWRGWHCAPSCPHQAQLRPFDHLGHSLTPRMQAVEGRHLQPMGTASPFPAPPPSHGGPGRARVGLGAGGGSGPQEGRCSGERRMSSQLPARPRPCCLCRAQLRAPGPAGARCPPRPGASLTSQGQEPVLPGMPGSSQRTLFPRGSGSPRTPSILILGRQEKD